MAKRDEVKELFNGDGTPDAPVEPTADAGATPTAQPSRESTALAKRPEGNTGLAAGSQVSSVAQIAGNWPALMCLGKGIWESGLAPKSLRNPQACATVILKGDELGIPPMTAIQELHVIDGKVGMSAELMRALILRKIPGSQIEVVESTDKVCTLKGSRPGHKPMEVSFTMEDATMQKLDGKDNWRKEPSDMLYARATSRLKRRYFPDACVGVYTTEEVMATLPEAGEAPEIDEDAPNAPHRAERGSNVSAAYTPEFQKLVALYVKRIEGATKETFAAWAMETLGTDEDLSKAEPWTTEMIDKLTITLEEGDSDD